MSDEFDDLFGPEPSVPTVTANSAVTVEPVEAKSVLVVPEKVLVSVDECIRVGTAIAIPVDAANALSLTSTPDTLPVIDDTEAVRLATENPEELPELLPMEGVPAEYIEMTKRILKQYAKLPVIDYKHFYAELTKLIVPSGPTPTMDVFNAEYHAVQAACERISEMFNIVLENYTFKKWALGQLQDAWGQFSQGKSAEKRKGEAAFLTTEFGMDFSRCDNLFKTIGSHIKMLEKHHASLVERVKVIQVQLKVGDVGRGNMPDMNFDKHGSEALNEMLNKTDVKNDGSPTVLFDGGDQVEI